jgi:hypothetical protein
LLQTDAVNQATRSVQRNETSLVDKSQPVGKLLCLLHEVGDQNDRYTAVPKFLDQLPGLPPGLRIQTRGQLIEDHCLMSSIFDTLSIILYTRPVRAATDMGD